jgi:hypothetical protein
MTTHKAEGQTVAEAWSRPDGSSHQGTVLVQAAGADQQSLYVALSRHVGEVRLFAGLDQVEDSQSAYERGPAASDSRRTARGIEAIAEHMGATETNENDRPVHEDLVDAAAAATLARVRARTPRPPTPQEEAAPAPTARTGEALAGDQLLPAMPTTSADRPDSTPPEATSPNERLRQVRRQLATKTRTVPPDSPGDDGDEQSTLLQRARRLRDRAVDRDDQAEQSPASSPERRRRGPSL